MVQGERNKRVGSKSYFTFAVVISLVVVVAAIGYIVIVPHSMPGGVLSPRGLVLEISENHNLSGSPAETMHDEMTTEVFGFGYNTTISSGSNVTLRIRLVNTSDTVINMSRNNLWPVVDGFSRALSIGPCGYYYPYGFAVFSGYLTMESIGYTPPLAIFEPGVYMCPLFLEFKYYSFQPYSDTAVVSGTNTPLNITLYSNLNFSGYWTYNGSVSGNTTSQNYHFNYFENGVYTILVADQWGAVSLMYFTVR